MRSILVLVLAISLSGCDGPAEGNPWVHRVFSGELQTPLAIRADNVAYKVDERWWRWTIYLEGLEDHLDRIECVEYLLHPTYMDPLVEVCDRGFGPRGFSLTHLAWGTFLVRIRIRLADGGDYRMRHFLRFRS